MLRNVVSSSSILGELVHSSDGAVTGQIEEILLDTEQSRIAFALISFEEIEGFGDRWIAFPWDGIKVDLSQGGDGFILDARAEILRSAPTFPKDNWPNFADPQFQKKLYRHFGLQNDGRSERKAQHELQ